MSTRGQFGVRRKPGGPEPKTRDWWVWVEGRCVGNVAETTEELARCAAINKFEIPKNAEFSVCRANF